MQRFNSPRLVSALALFALAASTAHAQQLTLDSKNVAAGSTVQVNYSGGEPGSTVKVRVHNGDPLDPERDTKFIVLDENGEGTLRWEVPKFGWEVAVFRTENTDSTSVTII